MKGMAELERRNTWWERERQSSDGMGVYLITGPRYIGKKDFAHACAADVLEVKTESLSAHPDFLFINPMADDERMPVEDLRELLLSVQTPSQKSKTRVVIIENIDQLSAQGQNALLKSIEEPRVPTVYFLLARSLESVLETVRSRAIHAPLNFVPHKEWAEKAQAHFEKQNQSTQLYLEGRPQLVDQMMSGKRESAKIEKAVQEIESLLRGSFGERLALSRTLAKKHDHKALGALLDDTLLVAHRAHVSVRMQRALVTAKSYTRRHLNKTFILDHIIFETYEHE